MMFSDLKGNQGTLHEAVKDFFDTAHANGFAHVAHDFIEEIDKDHGRFAQAVHGHCSIENRLHGRLDMVFGMMITALKFSLVKDLYALALPVHKKWFTVPYNTQNKMHNELKLSTSDLARFLQEKLPALSEDWWEKRVVDRLSFQQQRVIGEKNISSLRELDFAALLRILDQNWYDLSEKFTLPSETKN